MGEQDKQGKMPATTESVVVSRVPRSRLHTKLWIIGVICFVILSAVVTAGVALYQSRHSAQSPSEASKVTVSQQATGLYLSGDYKQAQQVLSQAISQTGDKTEQGKLYEQKANLAYTNGDYANGLQFAQLAEQLNPTANSANWIAQNAEKVGKKPLALKYYQLELQRIGKPVTPSGNAGLKAKIAELQAEAQ